MSVSSAPRKSGAEIRALAVRQGQAAREVPASSSLDTLTVAKLLAGSGFFGEVRQQGQALAKMLAGQELGMGPIASLMGVYFSNGKITYAANLMAAAIQKSPIYDYRVRKLDGTICVLEFFEHGESVGTSSFSLEEATTAELTTGVNRATWKKYPRNMLFARAMSNGCKWFCSGVFGGITPYTPDELGDEVTVTASGDVVPLQVQTIDQGSVAPSADEQARAQQMTQPPSAAPSEPLPLTVDERATLEYEYDRLALLAEQRGHRQWRRIKAKRAEELDNAVLAASVDSLTSWEQSLPPLESADGETDEEDEAF